MNLDELLFSVLHEAGALEKCPTDEEFYLTLRGDELNASFERAMKVLDERIRAGVDGFSYYASLDTDARMEKLEFAIDLLSVGACPWCERRKAASA